MTSHENVRHVRAQGELIYHQLKIPWKSLENSFKILENEQQDSVYNCKRSIVNLNGNKPTVECGL